MPRRTARGPQASLLFPPPEVHTRVITRKRDFEHLFEGYRRLRGISYVVSPGLLLELFERFGLERVEMVVGENLTGSYKSVLGEAGAELADSLARRMEASELIVWVPERTIHTKLYILEGETGARVIQTSANLTETARNAWRQANYAWHVDLSAGHPFFQQVMEDFATHTRRCERFMDDLLRLFGTRPELSRAEVIEAWLGGGAEPPSVAIAREMMGEVAARAVEHGGDEGEGVFSLTLPDSPVARRQTERLFASVDAQVVGDRAQFQVPAIVRHYQQNVGVPLMRIDHGGTGLMLGLGGSIVSRSAPLPEPEELGAALTHIEDYVNTVDRGSTTDPGYAKAAMFEALLYVMAAPFAHRHMPAMKRRFGFAHTRGPRFLYLYGPSQNGKTTFLQFATRLIAGEHVEPLEAHQLTPARIRNVQAMQTAFPLLFDDVNPSRRAGFEEIVKSYWEAWWSDGQVVPQVVMTSNVHTLRDWAKNRIKRVDFDVHFAPGDDDRAHLNRLFERRNDLFCWFARSYLDQFDPDTVSSDDELALARAVCIQLYAAAGRAVPDFFPREPLERLYDPGRRLWRDLLFGLRKAELSRSAGRDVVEFGRDMQPYELREYQAQLPQTVKYQRRGHTIVIDNPQVFEAWLGDGSGSRWWRRLLLRRR